MSLLNELNVACKFFISSSSFLAIFFNVVFFFVLYASHSQMRAACCAVRLFTAKAGSQIDAASPGPAIATCVYDLFIAAAPIAPSC
jgi:hypothetical protein